VRIGLSGARPEEFNIVPVCQRQLKVKKGLNMQPYLCELIVVEDPITGNTRGYQKTK